MCYHRIIPSLNGSLLPGLDLHLSQTSCLYTIPGLHRSLFVFNDLRYYILFQRGYTSCAIRDCFCAESEDRSSLPTLTSSSTSCTASYCDRQMSNNIWTSAWSSLTTARSSTTTRASWRIRTTSNWADWIPRTQRQDSNSLIAEMRRARRTIRHTRQLTPTVTPRKTARHISIMWTAAGFAWSFWTAPGWRSSTQWLSRRWRRWLRRTGMSAYSWY